MAIASIIVQPDSNKIEKIKEQLSAIPQLSLEKTAPSGELILIAEAPTLKALQHLCFDVAAIPGVLNTMPSYVTTADEADDE